MSTSTAKPQANNHRRSLALTPRLLLVVVLSVFVSACGFHLRGNIPLPSGISNMYLDGPSGTFRDQLATILENAGATLTETRAAADVVLRLQDVRSNRTLGTLDERGKADSYNLELTVKYRLRERGAAKGAVLRKATLRETRRYNFDPELVIESESEEADLLEDMEEDIALRIVRQLSTVTDLDYGDDAPAATEASALDQAPAADTTPAADDGA